MLKCLGKKKKRGGKTQAALQKTTFEINEISVPLISNRYWLLFLSQARPMPLDGNHHPLSMGLALKGIQWSSEQLICLSSRQSLTIGSFLLFFLPFFSLSHAHKNDEHICAFVGHIFNPYQYPFKKRHKNLFWKD